MPQHPKYQLDHVHVLVTDREKAAAWYEKIFGFERMWQSADPYGPLCVSGDGGTTALALFTSRVSSDPNRVVAFRVNGADFIAFVTSLARNEVLKSSDERLVGEDVVDHGDVLSYYFVDPDGNPFEVATYDVDDARMGLRGLDIEPMMRP